MVSQGHSPHFWAINNWWFNKLYVYTLYVPESEVSKLWETGSIENHGEHDPAELPEAGRPVG